jgi:hypothetical protein
VCAAALLVRSLRRRLGQPGRKYFYVNSTWKWENTPRLKKCSGRDATNQSIDYRIYSSTPFVPPLWVVLGVLVDVQIHSVFNVHVHHLCLDSGTFSLHKNRAKTTNIWREYLWTIWWTMLKHSWQAVNKNSFNPRPSSKQIATVGSVRLSYEPYCFSEETIFFSRNKSNGTLFSEANK